MLGSRDDIAFKSNVSGNFIIVAFCTGPTNLLRSRITVHWGGDGGERALQNYMTTSTVTFFRRPQCFPDRRLTQIHFKEIVSGTPFLTNTVL